MKISMPTFVITILCFIITLKILTYCEKTLEDFGKPTEEVMAAQFKALKLVNLELNKHIQKQDAMYEAMSHEYLYNMLHERLKELSKIDSFKSL